VTAVPGEQSQNAHTSILESRIRSEKASWRFFWLAVLLSVSQVLLAQPTQPATAPSTASATQTTTASTGTNASPGDPKSNSSALHWIAENLKDLAFIIGGVVAVILAIVAAVLFTKRGRLMILGAVLDGLAADPASAERLYAGVLRSESADQTRPRKIYDLVISVDEDRDRQKIYERVLTIEGDRGKISTAFINHLRNDADTSRLLLDLIVWEFGRNRIDDFIGLLTNPKTAKAVQDLVAARRDDQ
jgi:hypothetical protein